MISPVSLKRKVTFFQALQVLNKSTQRRVLFFAIFQSLLTFLDLVGVAAIGILGALAVRGVESQSPTGKVQKLLQLVNLDHKSFQTQAGAIAIFAATALVLKTISSAYFVKKSMNFLSREAAILSARLAKLYLNQDFADIQKRSRQETIYALTNGVEALTIGMVGSGINLFSDGLLLVMLSAGILVVEPIMGAMSFSLFGIVAFLMYRNTHVIAENLGRESSQMNIRSNTLLSDAIKGYREMLVRGTREQHLESFTSTRNTLANIDAKLGFMPNVSKYVLEISIVLIGLIIGSVQFITQDAYHAVGTIVIFMAAGSRMGPAILRIQQGAVKIRTSAGNSTATFQIIQEVTSRSIDISMLATQTSSGAQEFSANIFFENVSFKYPDSNEWALENISLKIEQGQTVAFVGPSGAGKSTLIDLLLGVNSATNGKVSVSGMSPREALKFWPGKTSYVPQDVTLLNASLLTNICFGLPEPDSNDRQLWDCIARAELSTYASSLPQGLSTLMGEGGFTPSGGELQRIGIARALFTNPSLLILDEATSALDGTTESNITSEMVKLKGKITLIIIAHRLSTIRNADLVAYIEDGRVKAFADLATVRKSVKDFDLQAGKMGL